MSFHKMFTFLRELNKNNSKEWMDRHRKRYHEIRDWYIDWLNQLDEKLNNLDKDYTRTEGRKAINRINNNLLYHPDKPVYKDHFGAGLDLGKNGKQGDFYIHIGINGSFLASGYHKPGKKILDSIREAIDYNGGEFREILDEEKFKNLFEHMGNEEVLKSAPKGYDSNHPYIDLLRRKSFAVKHDISQEQIMDDGFMDYCVMIYGELKPFRAYLNKAVSV